MRMRNKSKCECTNCELTDRCVAQNDALPIHAPHGCEKMRALYEFNQKLEEDANDTDRKNNMRILRLRG